MTQDPKPAPDTPPLLRVRDLHFAWPHGVLFESLGFDMGPGVGLVRGDDGCGKSTLLALLAGHLTLQRGTVQLGGCSLHTQPEAYRRQVFWIDPQTVEHDARTAADYLQGVAAHYPLFRPDVLADLVAGFDLAPHLAKPLYMLSTGSKRKVWLSAAFAAGAPLTLIDQPFAALDGPSLRFLRELLQEAADHPRRAWVIADHEAPAGTTLAAVIDL